MNIKLTTITVTGGISYIAQNIPGNMMQKTIIIVQGPTGGGPLTLTVCMPHILHLNYSSKSIIYRHGDDSQSSEVKCHRLRNAAVALLRLPRSCAYTLLEGLYSSRRTKLFALYAHIQCVVPSSWNEILSESISLSLIYLQYVGVYVCLFKTLKSF